MVRIFHREMYRSHGWLIFCTLCCVLQERHSWLLKDVWGGLWHWYFPQCSTKNESQRRSARPWTSLTFLVQVLQVGRIQPLFMVSILCELLQHVHDLALINVRGRLSFCKQKEKLNLLFFGFQPMTINILSKYWGHYPSHKTRQVDRLHLPFIKTKHGQSPLFYISWCANKEW